MHVTLLVLFSSPCNFTDGLALSGRNNKSITNHCAATLGQTSTGSKRVQRFLKIYTILHSAFLEDPTNSLRVDNGNEMNIPLD